MLAPSKRKIGSFNTEVSINLADDEELMGLMVEAGFTSVFIGIETPDEGSLAECNKKQNENRDLLEDIKHLQHAGLQVQGGFIVGFDSDTPSIFQRQIDFIQQSGIATAMVGLLQALPGTQLYARLKQEGQMLGPLDHLLSRNHHAVAFPEDPLQGVVGDVVIETRQQKINRQPQPQLDIGLDNIGIRCGKHHFRR